LNAGTWFRHGRATYGRAAEAPDQLGKGSARLLVHDTRAMKLDRARADCEIAGDRFV
jgi:hypothetical protein